MADTNQHGSDMAVRSIPHLILSFTATTLAALLFNSFYTLTDTLFVSRGVGDLAMGGISIVYPFTIIQGAISTAVGAGAASIVSRKLGEGRQKEAGEITRNAMLTFYCSAIAISALGFLFMTPILNLLGATQELYPYAKQYLTIILAGNVFSTGFSAIIRAEGKMRYALLIWVLPISINILLDALLILVFGWGVRGAAGATVACQFTSFLMCVLFFTKFSVQNFSGAKVKLRHIADILSVGLPSLIQMASLSVISVLLNNILGKAGGVTGITAFAYISRLLTFAVVPFTAVAQAAAPVIGFNYGAQNQARVTKALRFSLLLCLLYAVFAAAAMELFPAMPLHIFTENESIIAIGVSGLRITALSFLFTPLPMLAGTAFQAVGQKLPALFLYAANLFFLFPLVLIFAGPFGISGIWWAYALASAAAAVPAAYMLFVFTKKHV